MRERLNAIRMPRRQSRARSVGIAMGAFAAGAALGALAKGLDTLALDSAVWWHRVVETLDLGNFFSDLAVWLLAALILAVLSASALRAAGNVLCFFVGMCVAYHICSMLLGGFDPGSYMLRWYALTLLSPLLAVLCWYARGSGAVSILLDIGIFSVFTLSCFAVGLVYVSPKGVLYLLVYAAAAAVLYSSPKQLAVSLPVGFLLAFALSPVWPFQ